MTPRTRKLYFREKFLAKRSSLLCKKCELVGGYRLNGTAGGRTIVSCRSCSHRITGQQIVETLAKVDLPADAIDDEAEAERTEEEEEDEDEEETVTTPPPTRIITGVPTASAITLKRENARLRAQLARQQL